MHALTELIEKIRQACDSVQFACWIFLVIQKAFETVYHNILLRKQEHYGIRGVSNIWFKSYLTNRKQYGYHGGIISDDKLIEYEIPQESVLGSLLLIIFINNLAQTIEKSSVNHFADYANLIMFGKSFKKITLTKI